MSIPQKVCPVLIRTDRKGRTEILAFRHPKAGNQLVKGTIECNETLPQAALRELQEESGITHATIERDLCRFDTENPDQTWHVVLCKASNLPDAWVHLCEDDGGHEFCFFWQSLAPPTDGLRHSIFVTALREIETALCTLTDNA